MREQHTKEPWIIADDGTIEARFVGLVGHINASVADRRRIVACVNACTGIPTEQLEAIGQLSETGFSIKGVADLKQQRDELLVALKLARVNFAAKHLWDQACECETAISSVERQAAATVESEGS